MSTMKTTKIEKIVVVVGDEKLELTPEEARGLLNELEGLMGRPGGYYQPLYNPPYFWTPYPVWGGATSGTRGGATSGTSGNITTYYATNSNCQRTPT
jgi:hypothetical protein